MGAYYARKPRCMKNFEDWLTNKVIFQLWSRKWGSSAACFFPRFVSLRIPSLLQYDQMADEKILYSNDDLMAALDEAKCVSFREGCIEKLKYFMTNSNSQFWTNFPNHPRFTLEVRSCPLSKSTLSLFKDNWRNGHLFSILRRISAQQIQRDNFVLDGVILDSWSDSITRLVCREINRTVNKSTRMINLYIYEIARIWS